MEYERFYKRCMFLGKLSGCHQRPDRSFSIHGKQFPVCARCTGVFAGQLVSLILIHFFKPAFWILALFCIVMLLDWSIQYLKIRESTNLRRLITGSLCGYAFGTIILQIFLMIL